MKTLYDISWQVTEPEYRQHPALSYSTLARYEREGFSKLPTLFDHISSPSLTFGSVVDELITGDDKSFNERFIIASFPKLKPGEETAVKALNEAYGEEYKTLDTIPDSLMLPVLDTSSYNSHWKNDTRTRSLRTNQGCCDYYRLLRASDGKEVISQEVYDSAIACVEALHNSPATKVYLANDHGDISRFYQLKFKGIIDGVEYRCMADLIIVDYKRKAIIPCDLKTSSSPEYEFCHSFLKWRYDLQARLYWKLIRMAMDADEFFKDFVLKDYRFIVVNNETRTPLVWEFPKTQDEETLHIGGKNLRTPWEIGAELRKYLDDKPQVPDGISQTAAPNNICDWIEKHETYQN